MEKSAKIVAALVGIAVHTGPDSCPNVLLSGHGWLEDQVPDLICLIAVFEQQMDLRTIKRERRRSALLFHFLKPISSYSLLPCWRLVENQVWHPTWASSLDAWQPQPCPLATIYPSPLSSVLGPARHAGRIDDNRNNSVTQHSQTERTFRLYPTTTRILTSASVHCIVPLTLPMSKETQHMILPWRAAMGRLCSS